jgi:hypothetical protein
LSIEWLSFSKLIPAGSAAAKSIYDRTVGKSPRLNFDTDSGGIELHVFNTRDETIIVEYIEATPPLLGFAAGDQTIDVVRAIVAQRGQRTEQPIAVLSPSEKAKILVITFDPFDESDPRKTIKGSHALANRGTPEVFSKFGCNQH